MFHVQSSIELLYAINHFHHFSFHFHFHSRGSPMRGEKVGNFGNFSSFFWTGNPKYSRISVNSAMNLKIACWVILIGNNNIIGYFEHLRLGFFQFTIFQGITVICRGKPLDMGLARNHRIFPRKTVSASNKYKLNAVREYGHGRPQAGARGCTYTPGFWIAKFWHHHNFF